MEHFDAATVSAFHLLAAVIGDKIVVMAVMRGDVAQLPVSFCWKMFPSVWVNLNCVHTTSYLLYMYSSLIHTCVMYTTVCLYNTCPYNPESQSKNSLGMSGYSCRGITVTGRKYTHVHLYTLYLSLSKRLCSCMYSYDSARPL